MRRFSIVARRPRDVGRRGDRRSAALRLLLAGVPVVALMLAVLCVVPVDAQQPPVFSVSPRFYLTWVESSEFYEPVTLPIGGLTLSVAPFVNWDFVINGLYGEGDSKFREAAKNSEFGFGGNGHVDVTRTDIELLARYRIPDSPVFLMIGGRYVRFEEEFFLNATTPTFFAGKVEETTTQIYVGEVGVGFTAPISKDGRHSAFGNVLFGFGAFDNEVRPKNCRFDCSDERTNDDGFAYLVDTNVGYQYSIADWMSVGARYRIIAVQRNGHPDSDLSVVHGPEFALTFRF